MEAVLYGKPVLRQRNNKPHLSLTFKRLKKKLEREGIMKILKARKNYEKPSEKRRRKSRMSKSRKFSF